jgi:hypothetical protein
VFRRFEDAFLFRELLHRPILWNNPAVQLSFHRVPELPRLSWAARVVRDDPVVQVWHGPWVETRPDAFVEGAWDSPFDAGGFDRSAVLAGSGGRLSRDGVLFAGPANMYERLHSVRVDGTLVVSNSLAFALGRSGSRLAPGYHRYYPDLLDHYRNGIGVKEKHLRLAEGRRVALHDCCNVLVTADLETHRIEKAWGPPPESYAHYAENLADTLGRVIANAGARERSWRYRPLVMLSQGYDTTAVAALASRFGCRDAVTFRKSDSAAGYADDSGEAIGECLGYAVTACERSDYANMPEYAPEEFYLEPWGVDRTMVAMEGLLPGTLLLSGRSAETVWSRGGVGRWGLPDLHHPIDATPGCALGELRLRLGFLHFAPATIAAIHAPVIHPWNASPELEPWSIGGRYDKPIARRIAEEAGVPRHLFGQEKKGGPDPAHDPAAVRPGRFFSWYRRAMRRPRRRAVILRLVGNRLHPHWRAGAAEVEAGAERMIERYRRAVAIA